MKSKINIVVVFLLIMAILSGVISYKRWNKTSSKKQIILLSGNKNGVYYHKAIQIKNWLKNELNIKVVETHGAIDNVNRMLAGKGDIAFYQNVGNHQQNFNIIASLYREKVYILARKSITTLWDIQPKTRVFIGAENSGSEIKAKEILKQYRLYDIVSLTNKLNFSNIKNAFIQNEIDVAFLVLGSKNSIIKDILHSAEVHLLGIDLREGLVRNNPANSMDVIPANSFGKYLPLRDIPVISNVATLISNSKFPIETLSLIIQTLKKHSMLKKELLNEGHFDFPINPALLDILQDRWPTVLEREKIIHTKNWILATLIFFITAFLLFVFRQSVKESVDELLFISGYRARLRQIQEQFDSNISVANPQQILDDAQALADEISRDVKSGIVDKTVQLVFIHHEILQLVAKMLKREVIDNQKNRQLEEL